MLFVRTKQSKVTKWGGAHDFDGFNGWYFGVVLALIANRYGKEIRAVFSVSLVGEKKIHSCLLLKPRTLIDRPHVLPFIGLLCACSALPSANGWLASHLPLSSHFLNNVTSTRWTVSKEIPKNCVYRKIQIHKGFKRMLFIMTKHNMQ